jgi:hypothetical protein
MQQDGDWISAMKAMIKRYCINYIWHFTDQSNIESIKRLGGIFSLSELEKRDTLIPSPGGNDWSHDADKSKGMDKFVHLCFCCNHPMLYIAQNDGRIPNPVWLQVDKNILLDPDVRFTPDVSNKTGVPILDHDAAKEQIDFEVIYKRMDWKNPEIQQRRQIAEKSEILVPQVVPIEKIRNI